MLYLYLKHKTKLFEQPMSVLHFSPARGLRDVLERQENLNYATSWYEPDREADYHLDLTNLALPGESWDVVIAYHVLEHIPEDRRAMREIYRVLKPGGWALVQVPLRKEPDSLEDPSVTTDQERKAKFGQHDHVRYYGWKDFNDRLVHAGFEVTVEHPAKNLSEEQVRDYRLNANEAIYVLRKPLRAANVGGGAID